jgi:putative nucleotidyltransferase with HDIG domain
MPKVRLLIATVSLAAISAEIAVYLLYPGMLPGSLQAIVFLAVLAIVADLLSYVLPRSATGSIAFIPNFAAIIIAPGWVTPLVAFLVRLGMDPLARRSREKVIFNAAQQLFTQCLAILVYRELGGESLLSLQDSSLTQLAFTIGLPAIACFLTALISNTLLVCSAIGISNNAPILRVWAQNSLSTIVLDIAASPMIIVFAWLYTEFGPLAAATAWLPILGLREVYKTNYELKQTNEELLQLMVKSIEARDPYTSGHSRRVQSFATHIARALKLSDRDVQRISKAALLHDVGKIYDKYHPILTKPDKLTPAEWATMKEHPVDGAGLVATMTRLQELVPAIRHHHEHWDGTGYPDGLAGEQIPIEARVITLADTIDAMMSDRPYRAGLTPEQVRTEIIRCRGRQYDPEMVNRLLASPMWASLFAPASWDSQARSQRPAMHVREKIAS